MADRTTGAEQMTAFSRATVVVPTFDRGEILLETLDRVIRQGPDELIVIDQTPEHPAAVAQRLAGMARAGRIRWIRLERPSIPAAMNRGLTEATSEIVLFLDDDIIPCERLVAAHVEAHRAFPEAGAVVGQVLQPGEEPGPPPAPAGPRDGWLADIGFPFWSSQSDWVQNVMAGNLSVKREVALQCGGFDESFEGAAYRFETEFARRLIAAGSRIRFEPAASVRHLRVPRGGTRAHGRHLTSPSPAHSMGDYYFALRQGWSWATAAYIAKRPFREIATRFHLARPWYIPPKLIGEFRGFLRAWQCARKPPKLIS